MVLQQEAKVPVWGKADAGEKVTVTVADHTASTAASADGTWRVDLAPFPNGAAPMTMTVQGKNTLTFQDVLIGEVWLCSGQSNMWFPMKASMYAKTDGAKADDPSLRLYIVPLKTSLDPQTDQAGSWQLCTPESIQEFSTAGYFFGREMRSVLKRPIGLIDSSMGNSVIRLDEPLLPAAGTSLHELHHRVPKKRRQLPHIERGLHPTPIGLRNQS